VSTEITDAEVAEVLRAAGSAGIGPRIKLLRRQRGWSAQRLADVCAQAGLASLTRGAISKIEAGLRKSVTVDEAATLAAALGISPAVLISGHDDSGPVEDEAPPPVQHMWRARQVQVRGATREEIQAGKPMETTVLLRCRDCGDVAGRRVPGRWTLEDLQEGEQQ
jgi:transcriptional regulator with XRE-family HTH domain